MPRQLTTGSCATLLSATHASDFETPPSDAAYRRPLDSVRPLAFIAAVPLDANRGRPLVHPFVDHVFRSGRCMRLFPREMQAFESMCVVEGAVFGTWKHIC